MIGFQIRDVSIPYVVRTDIIQIDLQNLFDREADPFSISNQSPRLALNPKPKNRGHEPDPNLDPRVEDKKFAIAACWIVFKTNVCVKNTCRNCWRAILGESSFVCQSRASKDLNPPTGL